MISENLEKSLGDWKLPPSSALDVFEPRGCFSCLPDCRVKTVEKEIRLHEGFAMFPLLSNYRKKAHQICYNFLHVGMIQVALKPTKLGSNASAIVSLRDNRLRDPSSVLGMVESSLCDGPIYFFYLPTYCVPFSDSRDSFGIDVEIEGDESITLMYRFHYKVLKEPYVMDFSRRFPVDERGKTTLYLTNIAQNNRVVSKTISWGHQIGTGEGLVADESDLASSGEVGNGNVDWKETVKAHVLKVDVPGFKKKEVRVVVDDGRVLQLSGERSNEQEYEDEDETDKWHCEERSSGKFLRRLRLPENANLDEVKAAVDFGVLTVTVPKEEVDNKSEGEVIDISD